MAVFFHIVVGRLCVESAPALVLHFLLVLGKERFRLKGIDDILPRHEIDVGAAERLGEFLVLRLRVEYDKVFARFTQIGEDGF